MTRDDIERLLRDSILFGVRAKKGLTTADIQIDGDAKQIYISEHLTLTNKHLYLQARNKAKTSEYQYSWVRDGKIFVRKNDVSPVIFIKKIE